MQTSTAVNREVTREVFNMHKQQTIHCDVKSCKFQDNNYCGLQDIQVACCHDDARQTCCGSYECNGRG